MEMKKKESWIILLVMVLALIAYIGYQDGHEDVNDVMPDKELKVKD